MHASTAPPCTTQSRAAAVARTHAAPRRQKLRHEFRIQFFVLIKAVALATAQSWGDCVCLCTRRCCLMPAQCRHVGVQCTLYALCLKRYNNDVLVMQYRGGTAPAGPCSTGSWACNNNARYATPQTQRTEFVGCPLLCRRCIEQPLVGCHYASLIRIPEHHHSTHGSLVCWHPLKHASNTVFTAVHRSGRYSDTNELITVL